ncbi:YqeG family HAD IIIA-type phosphatase [Candidatus Saccharibacteria bacterium]|nr:YqeG family HAD IIIA-type phosphatase [Candidatus Saccharibacteria bacterium]
MSVFRADRKFERFEDVTPELLKKEGVKLLLCDLDNTLRLHSEKEPADELYDWVEDCRKAGVKIVVISNNGRKKMMQKFCEPLKIDCVWWAKKPVSAKLTETMQTHNFQPSETVMLGDKWSTDVLAARFAKVRAWQVEHRKKVV